MKKSSFPTLILASLLVASMTACTKKSTAITPYPSASSSAADNVQNYAPYQQGTEANPDYYGNGASLSDDNGEFNNPTTPQPTAGSSSTGSGTNISVGTGSDLDIGNLPNLEPYSPPGGATGGANAYSLAGAFPVDQDSYVPSSIPLVGNYVPSRNQWRAIGVAVSGSDVIVTAYDNSGLIKKGTFISLNSETGTSWKNIGSEWLGTKHPLNATVRGVTVDPSGQIYATDSTTYLYGLPKVNSVKKVEAGISGATDITYINGSLIVSTTSGIKKFDPSTMTAGTDYVAGVTATGGIGSDSEGNLFVVSGTTIKKVAPNGTVTDFITGIDGAIDVVPTDAKSVCVLTSDSVKLFDATGNIINSFGEGDFISPTAIAAHGKDVYVADQGTSYKDSNIVKYSILSL